MAGPKRPQDRVALPDVWESFVAAFRDHAEPDPKATEVGRFVAEGGNPRVDRIPGEDDVTRGPPTARRRVGHGWVVIAAITSCTNTSNPSVMVAAGLLAQKAVEAGLETKPWVKTSLAPGSRVVTDYLDRAGLTPYLDKLGFALVGLRVHDLHRQLRAADRRGRAAVDERDLNVVGGAVRQPELRGPGASAGARLLPRVAAAVRRVRARRPHRPRPHDRAARQRAPTGPCSCATSGRAPRRCATRSPTAITDEQFTTEYGRIWDGDEHWRGAAHADRPRLRVGGRPRPTCGSRRSSRDSTMLRPSGDIEGARVLVKVGDSITTDHISPAGSIKLDSPAGALPP